MLTDLEQRHLPGGRSVFVPRERNAFNPADYEVAEIPDDTTARAFVERFHYSRSYPAARERGGLFLHGRLVGVAVASQPMSDKVLDVLPCAREEGAELGRLVLSLDGASPFNLTSWFVTRWLQLLKKKGYAGLVSFADPVPRKDASGAVVFPGHVGVTYASLSAPFLGRATPRTLRLLPDGTVLSARALSKVRQRERGSRYVVEQLVAVGARRPAEQEDLLAWLHEVMPRVTRTMRHGGNLRYVLPIDPAVRRALCPRGKRQLPYPRFDANRGVVMLETV